jgi:hypothetical protein
MQLTVRSVSARCVKKRTAGGRLHLGPVAGADAFREPQPMKLKLAVLSIAAAAALPATAAAAKPERE